MTGKVDRDIRTLTKFIEIYCENKHKSREKSFWKGSEQVNYRPHENIEFCQDCTALLNYSIGRRALCPLNPKPACKNCKIHCYADEYRAGIREVMRFSGTYLIKRGRLDLIFHYLL
jgi:hypothetical protein